MKGVHGWSLVSTLGTATLGAVGVLWPLSGVVVGQEALTAFPQPQMEEITEESTVEASSQTAIDVMGIAPSSNQPAVSTRAADLGVPAGDRSDVLAQERMSEFGSDLEEVTVPPGNGEVITDIEVRFVDDGEPDDGRTRDYIILREFDLEPGDVYDPALAEDGLQRVLNLGIVRDASVTLEPTADPGQAVMVVTVDERLPFSIDFGLTLPHPSALEGPTEPEVVLPGTDRKGGISGGIVFQLDNLGGNDQSVALGLEGGETAFNYGVSFTDPWIDGTNRWGYSVDFFNMRQVNSIFDGGDEVELSNDNDPWVHRLGGGVEFFHPVSSTYAFATGINYQRVSVRDEVFTGDVFPEDELGNNLTFSDDGRDDLLSLAFSSAWDRRDDRQYPTEGFRVLFRTDQYLPVGDGEIFGNRLAANYTHYFQVPLFGFDDGPRTLIFNLQGGTYIGDLPPYEAFPLGGASSVRGYDAGEVGSGRSFVQATLEYRFPIFDFSLFREDIDVGGTLFVDYASDLGSGDTVPGEPAEVRNKPGDGAGFGGGLRAITPIGAVRLEVGITDEGDSEVMFQIGDRF
ncbi:MAG: BamA/TamA family outer membrane protein [Synechococcales bacterium]|nr:BamA/TamA family outer membrane protein [Synechococcales bacterium]